MPGQGATQAVGPSASYKETEVCKMSSSRYYSMDCHCKQMGMCLLGLACLGAGKGQLLNCLAPSLHHTQQVREEEELNSSPQTAIKMPGGKQPFYSPLGALRGRVVTLKNCSQGPSKARASFLVLQDAALGFSSSFLPGRFRIKKTPLKGCCYT